MKKGELHPRNKHRGQYDFKVLAELVPELKYFVKPNHAGVSSIDFADPTAVKLLNRGLLRQFYQLSEWDIPEHYLCPPIPGRADYVHYAADLLAETLGIPHAPKGPDIRVLDIGVGANCVYPIVGVSDYGWSFVGSDIDPGAFQSASAIVRANPGLSARVELRLQSQPQHILKGILREKERFHLSLCNPPFHASQAEANEVSARKWRNLGKAAVANFGGRHHELWCEGGEVSFIGKMIRESKMEPEACLWFTAFVSKEASLGELYGVLRSTQVSEWRTIQMAQGQKKSRFIAWHFRSPT